MDNEKKKLRCASPRRKSLFSLKNANLKKRSFGDEIRGKKRKQVAIPTKTVTITQYDYLTFGEETKMAYTVKHRIKDHSFIRNKIEKVKE